MKFKPQRMVAWYDVRQLARTGVKTVVSSIFGNFADKRELQAVLSEATPVDYTAQEDLWVDFISDLGDGFNATYTMASLMAQEQLKVGDHVLQRGKILIMGGDEVYPTPEKEHYENRLQGPYEAAFPKNADQTADERPHLFAIPGNHDWYDGLTNFIKLFCQERSLGNWQTRQKRSYFALKLAHDVWIWGIDVQLNADIDYPQLCYFGEITDKMPEGSKVILCTAEPGWIYQGVPAEENAYKRLEFFKNKFFKGGNATLLATLSGDMHHYARYAATDDKGREYNQLITAGGGGAFTHPTHFLADNVVIGPHITAQLKKTYPDKGTSSMMAFGNLLFPFLNWQMPLTFGLLHLFTSWFLQSTTKYRKAEGGQSFMELLAGYELSFHNLGRILDIMHYALSHNPAVVLLNLLLAASIAAFTDTTYGKGKLNWIAGGLHTLLQVVNFYLLIWVISRINLQMLELPLESGQQITLFTLEMVIGGGLVSGLIFGLYLLASTLLFKAHPTEAFSSMRLTRYKNFLRMHITKESVRIYPIGVRKVVSDWKNISENEEKPEFKGSEIDCELIEEPIVIHY